MTHASLPPSPTVEDFRALARSSPWRFATLHWTHRDLREDAGRGTVEQRTVEARLRRPGHLVVRVGDEVHVEEGAPYGISTPLTWPAADGRDPREQLSEAVPSPDAEPGLAPPEPGLAPPEHARAPAPLPTFHPDGLVSERPEDFHLEHGDPMWQSYLWTAMLDPEELAHDVELSEVRAADRLGRPTWWATAVARPGYEPRCGCCPLLLGQVSVELEYGPFDDADRGRRGWEARWDDLPTAYLVGLDVQTGIVVDVSPLDGSGGTRLTNEIHAVDADLAPPAPRAT